MTTKTTHSEEQAKAQLASIREMVAALECDYDRLEELRDERDDFEPAPVSMGDPAASSQTWEDANPDDAEELAELEAACTIGGDKMADADEARQRIEEDALSVEVRGDWYTPGESTPEPAEFCILLCTGGPAVRIVGDLSGGEPISARLEHQDWGTPWTEHFEAGAEKVLLKYAAVFCFGQ